jgi:predicted transcriptional regulator
MAGSCQSHHMSENKLLTAAEKAQEIGVSRSTLSRLVKAGMIQPETEYIGENGKRTAMYFTPETE